MTDWKITYKDTYTEYTATLCGKAAVVRLPPEAKDVEEYLKDFERRAIET